MRRIISNLWMMLIMCGCEQPAFVPDPLDEEVVGPDAGPDDRDREVDAGPRPPEVVIPLPGPSCGDGRWQPEAGESCDDGNIDDGDGCSGDCEIADCFVPATHASIQAGIDDADCAVVYVYSGAYRENLRIDRDLIIVGVGADTVVVDGGGAGSVFEISAADVTLQRFTIQGGKAGRGGGVYCAGEALTLTDMQIRDNLATADGHAEGGGIYSATERLTLIRTHVVENQVESSEQGRGGGVYSAGSRLLLDEGSKVARNRVQVSGAGPALEAQGGGIFQRRGELVLAGGSSISDNLARAEGPGSSDPDLVVMARGGGVAMQRGVLDMQAGSSLYGNRAESESELRATAHGGAVFMQELGPPSAEDYPLRLSMAGAALVDNRAVAVSRGVETGSQSHARGGAIYASSRHAGQAEVSINDSMISDNVAKAASALSWASIAQGGGAYAAGAGHPRMLVAVEDATMTANVAIAEGLGQGGALHLETLTHDADLAFAFRRSTASDNRAQSSARGMAEGGALHVSATGTDAFIRGEVTNSTVSNNQSVAVEGTGRGGGVSVVRLTGDSDVLVSFHSATVAHNHATITGGGIDIRDYTPAGRAEVTLRNSIVAGNSSLLAPDCATYHPQARVQSRGYNLLGSAFGCKFVGHGDTDLVDLDPLLGQLSWNGGKTMTHALLPGSPAIDAGDPNGCVDGAGNDLGRDQRGWQRVGHCDIGACEHDDQRPDS